MAFFGDEEYSPRPFSADRIAPVITCPPSWPIVITDRVVNGPFNILEATGTDDETPVDQLIFDTVGPDITGLTGKYDRPKEFRFLQTSYTFVSEK